MEHGNKGRKRPDLVERNKNRIITGEFKGVGNPMFGKPRPDARVYMKERNPMKNPEVAKKASRKGKHGPKNPFIVEFNKSPERREQQRQIFLNNNPMKRPEVRAKVSLDKHPNWQGGKSFEYYGLDFNSELKERIRIRDNYQCKECGYFQKDLGYRLHIHHIDYDKKNNDPMNLISLCRSCHLKTNYERSDWTNYYSLLIGGSYGHKET